MKSLEEQFVEEIKWFLSLLFTGCAWISFILMVVFFFAYLIAKYLGVF